MIFRNYFIINLALFILIIFLGLKTFNVISYPTDTFMKPKARVVERKSVSITPKIGLASESVFNVISDKNIFSPSRRLFTPKTGTVAAQASPKDTPKLYGTIIIGNRKSAMLQDPETKVTRNYYVNDTVGDFVVKDIQEEKVILLLGEETIEVKLREKKRPSSSRPSSRERRSAPVQDLQRKRPTASESPK